MDDDYTPTTEDVCQAYMNGVWDGGAGEAGPHVEAVFNRWLAQRDAEVVTLGSLDTAESVLAQERQDWADWIESVQSHVPPHGSTSLTIEGIITALRSPHRPFGKKEHDHE